MTNPPRHYFRSRLARAILLASFWSLVGLLFLLKSYIFSTNYDRPFNWARTVPYVMSGYWLWALFTPLMLWLSRQFPLERAKWIKNLLILLGLGLLIAPLHRSLTMLVSLFAHQQLGILNRGIMESLASAKIAILGGSIDSLVMYWTILAVFFSFNYYRKYQQQKLKFSQLETQLAEARLQALKMQLHPHFLFNTLNAISTLMDEDVKTARKMMARLGDLLRMALEDPKNTGAIEMLRYLEGNGRAAGK